ncbi:MAG TPA: hypothetical protein VGI14_10705 [Casimicrobiaceae bacterium]
MKELAVWYVTLVLGACIVGIVAASRFGRPSWYRTYTTEARFDLSQALFAMLHVGVYFVLCLIVLRIGRAYVVDKASDLWALVQLSPVLLGMVAVVVLPMIGWLDRWPREVLHRLAGAPSEGLRLAHVLESADFVASGDVDEETRALLERRGIDVTADCVDPARVALDQFVKATHLFLRLRAWASGPRYESFLMETRHDFDRLRQRFDDLSLKVARTFDHIERIGTLSYFLTSANATLEATGAYAVAAMNRAEPAEKPGWNPADMVRKLVEDLLSDLHDEIARFLKDARLLAARAVLTSEMTERGRAASLSRLGFRITQQAVRPSYEVLVFVGAGIFSICWLFLTLLYAADPGPGVLRNGSLAMLIAIVQGAALAVAVVPKTLWRFANSGLTGHTPWGFVIGAGAVAFFVSMLINAIVGLFIGQPMERLFMSLPWWPMALATASIAAFLVQDKRWARVESLRQRRLLDAASMAGGWCAGNLLGSKVLSPFAAQWAEHLLGHGIGSGQTTLAGCTTETCTTLVGLAFSTLIGAVIGWIVPHTFRDRAALDAALRLPVAASAPLASQARVASAAAG